MPSEVLTPKLFKELIAAALPVLDLRDNDGTKANYSIFLSESATQQQIDSAAAILVAHDPTDFPALNRQDVLTRLQASALWGKTPAQIYTIMQNQMDAWTSLADARASLRVWLPLMAAAIFWLASNQE